MRDNGPQNHHIVTLSTVDSPIVQEINSLAGRLGVAGFAINSKINIMSLPTNRNVAFSLGISPHLGRTLSSYQTPQFDINDIVAGSRDFSDAQLGDHNVLSKSVSQYYDLAATSRTAILGGNLFPSRPFLTAPALTSSNAANDIFANAYIGGRVIVRSDVADPAFSNPPPESFPASSGFEPLGGFTSAPALDPMEGFNLAPAFENNPGLIAAPAMPALPTSVPVSYPLGPTYSVPLMDVPTFSFPDLNGVPAQNLPDFGQMVGQPVVASPSYPTIAEDQLIPACVDQDGYAHSRSPMEVIVSGRSTSLFQASQQMPRMSS